MDSAGPRLSVERRMLLHLLKYTTAYEEAWEVPHAISQEGISEALDLLLNNVSRSMKRLKKEGVVIERLAHIKGVKRRRRAYFLTDVGLGMAETIRDEALGLAVMYVDNEGNRKDLTVDRVIGQYRLEAGTTIAATDVIEELRRNNVFDSEKYRSAKEAMREKDETPRAKAFLDLTDNAPRLGSFVGREGEVIRIEQCIEGPGPSMIILHGMAGIGKTSVALKVMEDLRGRRHIFYHRFHSWDSIQTLASALMDLLDKLGCRPKAGTAVENIGVNELVAMLGRGLSRHPVLLVFDDFHKVRDEVSPLFRAMTDLANQFDRLRVLVVGREVPRFYGRRDVTVNRSVEEVHLDSLGKEEVRQLIGEDYGEEGIDRIFELSRGIPLFLEILSSVDNVDAIADVQRYVEEEIYSELELGQRTVLQNLSVHRYPVPSEAVIVTGASSEDLSVLCRKSLVMELPHRMFEAHDLVKEFVYERMPHDMRERAHIVAARFYEGSSANPRPFEDIYYSSDLARLEAVHHMEKGGSMQEAADLLLIAGPELCRRGYTEVKALLEPLDEGRVDNETWASLLLLRGDVAAIDEDWSLALANYEKALEEKRALGSDKATLALIHGMIGKAQMKVQRWEETIRSHMDALRIYEESGDARGMAKELINLGIVYRNRKDWRKALESYTKARRHLEELEDSSGLVVLHNNLAQLWMGQGDIGKAGKDISKGLALADRIDDSLGKAVILFTRGEMWGELGKVRKAEGDFETSANIFREKKELDSAITVYLKLGDVLEANELLDKAMKAYLKALDVYQFKKGVDVSFFRRRRGSEDHGMLAILYDRLSSVSKRRGDLDQALMYDEKAMESYESSGDKPSMAMKLLDMGIGFEETGRLDRSLVNLGRALDILIDVGDRKGIAVVSLNKARVLKRKGDVKNSERNLKKVITIAEELGEAELARIGREEMQRLKRKEMPKKRSKTKR